MGNFDFGIIASAATIATESVALIEALKRLNGDAGPSKRAPERGGENE